MMNEKKNDSVKGYLPDWVDEENGDAFASFIKMGVTGTNKAPFGETRLKKGEPSVDEYVKGILSNNKTILAKAITLVESNSVSHFSKGRDVLKRVADNSGSSFRIGITGPPGVGKSTLIEEVGLKLIEKGHKVAVLAVDPSSTVTRGSILGDKTRMEKLSREENCFIRPSPSGGTLGGVTRKSFETMLLCEAAGYDVVLIETIGVGQSEITVRSMVDFFLLIIMPGGGDELQGIKRGVMELADLIVVNKSDGNNLERAQLTKVEYSNAIRYLSTPTEGWEREVISVSALEKKGIGEIIKIAENFINTIRRSGLFLERRGEQSFQRTISMVEDFLKDSFYENKNVKKKIEEVRDKIIAGKMIPTDGAEILLKSYFGQ